MIIVDNSQQIQYILFCTIPVNGHYNSILLVVVTTVMVRKYKTHLLKGKELSVKKFKDFHCKH